MSIFRIQITYFQLLFVLFANTLLISCTSVNLSDYALPEEPPPLLAEKSIAVLPFRGSVPTLDPAGEWFAHKLSMSGKLKVIAPAKVELLLSDLGKASLLQWTSSQEAAEIGQEIGAELIAMGKITTERSTFQMKSVCEVTLVESNTGMEIGHYKGVDPITSNFDLAVHYMRSANKAAFEIIGAKHVPSE